MSHLVVRTEDAVITEGHIEVMCTWCGRACLASIEGCKLAKLIGRNGGEDIHICLNCFDRVTVTDEYLDGHGQTI
jgi:hypothetical protein